LNAPRRYSAATARLLRAAAVSIELAYVGTVQVANGSDTTFFSTYRLLSVSSQYFNLLTDDCP